MSHLTWDFTQWTTEGIHTGAERSILGHLASTSILAEKHARCLGSCKRNKDNVKNIAYKVPEIMTDMTKHAICLEPPTSLRCPLYQVSMLDYGNDHWH